MPETAEPPPLELPPNKDGWDEPTGRFNALESLENTVELVFGIFILPTEAEGIEGDVPLGKANAEVD